MKAERILYLCADRGIPVDGTKGSSVHIRQFLAAMKRASYQPIALVASRGSNAGAQFEVPVLEIHSGSHRDPDVTAGTSAADRYQIREAEDIHANQVVESRLEEIFAEQPFDLIYERYSLFGLAGIHFARRHGIPHVLEVNAPLVPEASRYRGLVNKELAAGMEELLFRTTDHIVAVSNSIRDYVRNIAPSASVTVVPNGVDLERFENHDPVPDGHDNGTQNPLRDFVVGFVGTVRPWHGVDILLEAIGELYSINPAFSLCIVGEGGALQPELQRRARKLGIAGRVRFTGPIPFEQIPIIERQMDVLVAPYPEMHDFYFSPLKIFEYMASGRPIVASAIGQITEILRHEHTALLVKPGDQKALKDSLLRLRNDPKLARRLGAEARAEVHRKHDWKQRIDQITAIIAGLKVRSRNGVGHAA